MGDDKTVSLCLTFGFLPLFLLRCFRVGASVSMLFLSLCCCCFFLSMPFVVFYPKYVYVQFQSVDL